MDRHEYEINQLINPKKDIVKSNSKHRDNIETLILGRRIGGIVGGGDTPKQNTLVAVAKFNNNGYIIGEIVENTFICDAMEDNVAFAIDNNGVVEQVGVGSFNQFYDARIKPLLETQFQIEGYTMNVTSELVPGNTVPDWDDYIKITS